MPHLAQIALVVRDYDEALTFYCGKLGFKLVEDSPVPEQGKRWVVIAPPGAPEGGANLLLARAATPEQAQAIGNQSGGRVFLFLATDDFDRDHAAFTAAGVRFIRPPRSEPYGKVAVFEDCYGNLWDLIQYAGG
jgi:catechol 2,3-dioxygenase-like lactoylglutathione lyase family enzyme